MTDGKVAPRVDKHPTLPTFVTNICELVFNDDAIEDDPNFRMTHEHRWFEFLTGVVGVLHCKNRDYNDSYRKSSVWETTLLAATRMKDKCDRLVNLSLIAMAKERGIDLGEQEVSDEGILDTLGDVAGYAALVGAEVILSKEEEDAYMEYLEVAAENAEGAEVSH